MALSTVVLAASQHMLRLAVNGPGGETPDFATITKDALVAACAAGPLKELFQSPFTESPPGPGVSAWINLAEDARLTVSQYVGGVGGTPVVTNFPQANALFVTTGGGTNQLEIGVSSAGTVITELRFNHSMGR